MDVDDYELALALSASVSTATVQLDWNNRTPVKSQGGKRGGRVSYERRSLLAIDSDSDEEEISPTPYIEERYTCHLPLCCLLCVIFVYPGTSEVPCG
jgi:hypothetical protein